MPANRKHKAKIRKPVIPERTEGAGDAKTTLPARKGPAGFPIVGIGASAGGLAAFEAFFSGMPAGVAAGIAFVLVQHLAPDHKSILAELISHYTRMQVFEVKDGMKARPDCAYIIPPNYDMTILNGAFQLFEPTSPRGQRLPIDLFFRSLAQDLGERAVCVVLSGTGSDGALGVRAVKGEGGMAIAQTPSSTEYDGMPRSAIATGLVDYELSPREMPAQIIAYVSRAFARRPLPAVQAPKTETALNKVFVLLRTHTGHDFSHYKPNTLHRRIERRMAVQQLENLDQYVSYLQKTPEEVQALFHDLLIGVTKFFRDPEAFKVLEELVIPSLFEGKSADADVRVWVPGCSTGEEAYSIAILLMERMETLKRSFRVQVFATDLDAKAVASARAGSYPASIAADVSPSRLGRFFSPEPGGEFYRIAKGLRDMLVFSEQDIIKDPPFSRLDLISCRNLMIYMGGELQKKLVPLFHYALNPAGFLFLGTSESVGDFIALFETLDRKAKVYRRKPEIPGWRRQTLGGFIAPSVAAGPEAARPPGRTTRPSKLSLRELAEQALLSQAVPAAALVNSDGDILYLHGRFGLYLEPPPGEAGISNLFKMAREGLRLELTAALYKAASGGAAVRRTGLRVTMNGGITAVDLAVSPVVTGPGKAKLYLVIIEESLSPRVRQAAEGKSSDGQVAQLRAELRAKEEYLRAANEEMETSNEELKSSNEEMQSVNEELQSTNEELETSKEELQSVNEELSTVNSELQTKVTDLSRANNDMNNLMAGTGIATVFVDQALRIMRFNPAATKIINLIAGDVGRPVGHLVSNLSGYDNLLPDAQAVLDTLVPKEMDVQTKEGGWYTMTIRPYRTIENVIEGLVLTFVDITEIRKFREARHDSDTLRRLAAVVLDSRDAVIMQGLDGRILAWNPRAQSLYGWSEPEALAMNIRDMVPAEDRKGAASVLRRLAEGNIKTPLEARRLAKGGRIINVRITANVLVNEDGEVYAIATTEEALPG